MIILNAGVAQLVEHHVANVRVEGSNPFSRSKADPSFDPNSILWRRTQVVKGPVCKTDIRRFESGRRLQISLASIVIYAKTRVH